jgi:hypothetical protein
MSECLCDRFRRNGLESSVNAIDKGHEMARESQVSMNLGESLCGIFIEHQRAGVDIAVFLHSRHTLQSRRGASLAVGITNTDSARQQTNILVKSSTGRLLIGDNSILVESCGLVS